MPEDKTPEEQIPTEPSPEETPVFVWPATAAEEPAETPVETPSETPVALTDASPPTTDAPTFTTPPKAPKKKKMIIIGAIIIGALGLISGGTAAAYNLWYQNPDKVVMDAVGSLLQSGTSTHKITIDAKSKDTVVKISIDAKVAQSPASEADVNAALTYGGKEYDITGGLLTDKDGNMYFKVNNVKALLTQLAGGTSDFGALNSVITKIDGQWIKVSSDDLKPISADYSKTQKCVADALKSLDDKATINELTDVYKKNQFIVVGDKLGAKDIDGTASLGYKVTIDEAKTKAFYVALGDTKVGKALTACDSSFAFKASDLDSSDSSNKTTTEAEVWASRFGHQLTEFNMTGKDTDGTTATIVWNPKFVKGVTVSAPSTSVPIKDVITDVGNAYTDYYTSQYSGNPSYSSADFSTSSATTDQLTQLLLR